MFRSRRFPVHLPLLSGVTLSFLLLVVALVTVQSSTLSGTDDSVFLPYITKSSLPDSSITLVPLAAFPDTDTITDIASTGVPGDDRLFVLEREGVIRIMTTDGELLPTPFLDMKELVEDQGTWEEGLLGLAFHPDYAQNGLFFVSYTGATGNELQTQLILRRYKVSADPNLADPSSSVRLFVVPKQAPAHNGGDLEFGPDGYLYMGIGDGGPDPFIDDLPGDYPEFDAQSGDTLLGKIVRLDIDNKPESLLPSYACFPPASDVGSFKVPNDNPFVGDPSVLCKEIYAFGFRNPWRISIDPVTADLYIGDVGEYQREELNLIPAGSGGGQNFGWHCFEGTVDYVDLFSGGDPNYPEIYYDELVASCADVGPTTFPVYEYVPEGWGSIIAGVVYRGNDYPGIQGQFLYHDFGSGRVFRTSAASGWTPTLLLDPEFSDIVRIGTFGTDSRGEVYVGEYNQNQSPRVYRVTVP